MSLTVGATRSSVVPSGTLASLATPAPANTIGTRVSVNVPVAGHGIRRPSISVYTSVPSATPRTSGERPSRNPFTIPSFTSRGSGQNGTRRASPPDASHERPTQVAVSTAAGIPIAASATSIARRRRPVTRGHAIALGWAWVVVPGGVVFRMRADDLPTCVRRARRPARHGCRVLGRGGRAPRSPPNLVSGGRELGQHRVRARRPGLGLGRQPRVDRVLDAARVAAPDLAGEQRRPERRDPDPADRAELRGLGASARRALAVRAGHPDVLVRARPRARRPASSSVRSRSRASRRHRPSCSGSRSARSTARRWSRRSPATRRRHG